MAKLKSGERYRGPDMCRECSGAGAIHRNTAQFYGMSECWLCEGDGHQPTPAIAEQRLGLLKAKSVQRSEDMAPTRRN